MMLSILALNEFDSHLWDNFSVPSALDKQTAIDYILESCAELELLYSDPEIIKYMIRNWVRTEGHIWDKLAETLDLDYNPIYNLDVTWEETRTPDLTRTRARQREAGQSQRKNPEPSPHAQLARNPDGKAVTKHKPGQEQRRRENPAPIKLSLADMVTRV